MRGPILELAGVRLARFAGSARAGQSNTLTEVFFRVDSAALCEAVIDCSCDPRGAPAYNVGPSIRRAECAKHLIAKGLDPDRC